MEWTTPKASRRRPPDAGDGVTTVVTHQHRFAEHYQKVREIVASSALGRVHTVYGHATGWMMRMLTHLIDYARLVSQSNEKQARRDPCIGRRG